MPRHRASRATGVVIHLAAMALIQATCASILKPYRGQARSYRARLFSTMSIFLTPRHRESGEISVGATGVAPTLPAIALDQAAHALRLKPNREQGGRHRAHAYGNRLLAAMAAGLLMFTAPAFAAPLPELTLLSEHPVDGMTGGNLSGLAVCSGQLWTVSDRDDNVLYRLETAQTLWRAEPEEINVPPVPESDLPAKLRSMAKLSSLVRGGSLDYEGISCDAAGNRYVVSEANAEVLKVPVSGPPTWLKLPAGLVEQARAKGMLQHFNAIFEGLAVSPQGDRLWLAAEREQRGLLAVNREDDAWRCKGSCVLRAEPGKEVLPPQVGGKTVSRDFADLSLFEGKLFTLERSAYRICRRSLQTGKTERCWSFAQEALVPSRRYDTPFAVTEALVVDQSSAWVGIDNNFDRRADGEMRPIVWRFAAPAGGWSAAR